MQASAVPSTEQKGLTDWKNEPSVNDLDHDFKAAESSQEDFRAKLKEYKLTRDGGKPITASKPGKSVARPLVVRKLNEWKYSAMEEPFLNTPDMYTLNPRTAEDTEAAFQNALVLNYQWGTQVPKIKIVGNIVRNFVDEGTVIVKTGWEAEYGMSTVEEEQPVYASPEESYQLIQEAVNNGEMAPERAQAMMEMGEPVQTGVEKVYVEKETLVVNQPTYEVCITGNVTIDPTCEGVMANANFAVHEYDIDFATLTKDAYTEEVIVDPETGEESVESSGFYHNLDKLQASGDSTHDEFKSDASNNFEYQDTPRKKLRAYEYWGFWDIHGTGELVSIVATWINNVMVRMEENPFPHKRIPFSIAVYMPQKQEIHGEPDAALLKENQESIGRMTRAAHDITATVAVGQTFVDENFFPSPTQKNNYESGNTVYYRGGMQPKNAVFKQSVEAVPNTVFNMISMQTADAEALTGTRPFNTGANGSLTGTATGVRSAMDSTAKRELSVLRRLSDLFVDMGRMTIAMNQAFLSEEEVVRVTNSEFITIRRDDLAGNFDLRIEISTPEKDNEIADKLMTLMQTNAANMDSKLAQMHYVKIAKLWKLDDLAEEVGSYVPESDPRESELLDLQLENAKLENQKLLKDLEEADSRIIERISRSEENELDMTNKAAQAELRAAQAELALANAKLAAANAGKVEAEQDHLDQDFIDRTDGSKRTREIEDQEFKAMTDQASRADKERADLRKAQYNQFVKNTGALDAGN